MRIALDRTRIQALLITIPLILVLGAGGYYWFFVRPMYGVSHEPYMAGDTAVRAVAKPVLVQSYVSSLAHTGTRFVRGVPKVTSLQQFTFRTEWVHKMPFEFTFLFDQRSPDYLGVSLYVQEHPASESFADLVNDSGFFPALYPIRWERPRMTRQGTNQLLATGTLPVPQPTRDAVSAHFPDYYPLDAPPVRGDHFVEVAVNNQNGALMEMHGAFSRLTGLLSDPALERQLKMLWPAVEAARVTADLAGPDHLAIHVLVECIDAAGANAALATLDRAENAIGAYLASRYGFGFDGAARLEGGGAVAGVYTFTGFEARLRGALGG